MSDEDFGSLRSAVCDGSFDRVQTYLRRNPELAGQTDETQATALHLAARTGNERIAGLLLEVNPQLVSARDKDGRLPLHWAAAGGHSDIVTLLIDRAQNLLHLQNRWGQTVLHEAVREGHAAVASILLVRSPALTGIRDELGWTPAHWASALGKIELRDLLFRNNPSTFTTKSKSGKTPAECGTTNSPVPPSAWRLFEIAAGLAAWSGEEKAWLLERPIWRRHEQAMRNLIGDIDRERRGHSSNQVSPVAKPPPGRC